MLNKKGFMSMSLIYSFFLVFVAIILALLANYAHNRILYGKIKSDIKSQLDGLVSYSPDTATPDPIEGTIQYLLLDGSKATTIQNKGIPAFNTAATTNLGMYAVNEGNKRYSYYFRGIANNNVTFAGFAWKIVRVNSDGSLRLIYNGLAPSSTGVDATIGSTKYNETRDQNAYIGYMYSTPGSETFSKEHYDEPLNDSTIKTILDEWFQENLLEHLNKLEDAGYCADRTMLPFNTPTGNTGYGYGKELTYYSSYGRLNTNKNPEVKCSNANDLYTVSVLKGNGKLTYPIGLITADDVMMAGATLAANNSYYLYSNYDYWTMTPSAFNNEAYLWSVSPNGSLKHNNNAELGIRPVINLRRTIQHASGTGSVDDPYIIN